MRIVQVTQTRSDRANMNVILLLLLVLQHRAYVGGQFTAPPPTCPSDTFTFRCTVAGDSNGITIWRVGGSSHECSLLYSNTNPDVISTCGPGGAFTATFDATNATSFSSTLSGTAHLALDGTLVECFGPALRRDAGNMVGNSTLQIVGPPSRPTLSCVDLSEDANGTVNVTVSWTLSGEDSADFYLINIATNDPQPPYGGLLNITTPSVTQRELTGFQAGYEYTITVRGVNCGSQEGSESEPLTITPQVPMSPMPKVCAEYDRTNGALQTIDSTWDEVDLVTVSADCSNGQDIRASYELSYTSSSGASITTCVVDGTDCSNGVCYHELQDNVTDSRCQPPVSQFDNESVTVTVTAGNIVGRSNPAVYRSIGSMNLLEVVVDSTDPASTFVECMFEAGYSCTIDYGTDPSYTNLTSRDASSTQDQVTTTITLSQEIKTNTTYYFIVSAESTSQCERLRGTFRTECTELDLSDLGNTAQDGMLDLRCGDRQFGSSSPISNGVVCYNGTAAMSEAVYICDDNSRLATRVCQNDGNWNGSIPLCMSPESLPGRNFPLTVVGGTTLVVTLMVFIAGIVGLLIITRIVASCWYPCTVALDKCRGATDDGSSTSGSSVPPQDTNKSRVAADDGSSTSGSSVPPHEDDTVISVKHQVIIKMDWWVRILFISLMTVTGVFLIIGVALWIAVGVVVSYPPNGDIFDLSFRNSRDGLVISGFVFSILAFIYGIAAMILVVYTKCGKLPSGKCATFCVVVMIVLLCLSVIGIPLAIVVLYFKNAENDAGVFKSRVVVDDGSSTSRSSVRSHGGATCCVVVMIILLCLSVIGILFAIIVCYMHFKERQGDTKDTGRSPKEDEQKDLNSKKQVSRGVQMKDVTDIADERLGDFPLRRFDENSEEEPYSMCGSHGNSTSPT